MVRVTARNWALEAQKRGYIVVIPAAPAGQLFFKEGGKVFPEFLDKLLNDYKIRDNKFHVAGMSNGGISAFHVAASYPQYFLSVIGFPGYLPDPTPERVSALANLCIYMHVGELDQGWLKSVQTQAAEFRAKGYPVRVTVEKGEQHVIRGLTGPGRGSIVSGNRRKASGLRGVRVGNGKGVSVLAMPTVPVLLEV